MRILSAAIGFWLTCYIFKLYIIWMSLCLEKKIKYLVSLKGLLVFLAVECGPRGPHSHS